MRTLAMTALLAAIAVPLAGCVVNSREPASRTVVREPAAPSATVVAPAPRASVVVAP